MILQGVCLFVQGALIFISILAKHLNFYIFSHITIDCLTLGKEAKL